MKIILYVPGMVFNGDTIKDGKSLGGSESAGYYVAKELAKRDHQVIVFSNISTQEEGLYDNVLYLGIGQMHEKNPFGDNFIRYATVVPHDVLIAQRTPHIFTQRFNSKINLWWTHDLALKRMQGLVNQQIWNINKILCVSEYHKKQVQETYGINNRILDVLLNAVDKDLYHTNIDTIGKFRSKTILFSSRPERGLENLVKIDGIMEKILKQDPEIKLVVTGYENTTQAMANYYNQLYERCRILPNVQFLGTQSKQQQAILEQNASLQIYPTEFEETSCITAMNTQVAGTPFVASKFGALPETLNNGGVFWVDTSKLGTIDCDNFTEKIVKTLMHYDEYKEASIRCIEKGKDYCWKKNVDNLETIIQKEFKLLTLNKATTLNHFYRTSDAVVALDYCDKNPELKKNAIFKQIQSEYTYLKTEKNIVSFYDNIAQYNIDIQNNHALGNDLHLHQPRTKPILEWLKQFNNGDTILDYGCCVGQLTTVFAKVFPYLTFIGVDIAQSQIDIANEFIKTEKITNVFYKCVPSPKILADTVSQKFNGILCTEVLEHVENPVTFLSNLEKCGVSEAPVLISTPSGAYEELRWGERQTREHVHHFEYEDIHDMLKHKQNFDVKYIHVEKNKAGEILGNYATSWEIDGKQINEINKDRKLNIQAPRQTLSVCLIVGKEGLSLGKTLESVAQIADEIIIGIDGKQNDGFAWEIAKKYNAIVFSAENPSSVGFDIARNTTIGKATKDWILWIDDDEVLQWPSNVLKYLRQNQFDAYAIPQHHYSAQPAGLIKTDLPCRLFRNNVGIKFHGVVHEHPETKLNEGPGHTFVISQEDVAITHNGYDTEETRRKRFERNFPLMQLDRKKYPARELGRFLWIRDLAHINRFEFEQTSTISLVMTQRAEEAITIWRDFVKDKKARLVKDSMQYYSECVNILVGSGGIDYKTSLAMNKNGIGDNFAQPESIQGKFQNKEDIELLTSMLIAERAKVFDSKYL